MYGGGGKLAPLPHHTNFSETSRIWVAKLYVCSVRSQQINFKLGNLTTHLKALFPLGLTDFPQLVHVKSLKKTLKGLLLLIHKIFLGTLALTFLISDIGLVSFEWNITSYGKKTKQTHYKNGTSIILKKLTQLGN